MASRDCIEIKTDKKINLPSGTGFTPQSLALISSAQRIVLCSGSSPNHVLYCSASKYTDKGKIPNVGHANGGTYCNKNGLIYATAYEGGSNKNKIRALDISTYKVKFTVTLPTSATGIAYDRVTNQFYISSGNKVYVYPFDAFSKGGTYKGTYTSFSKKFTSDNRDNQDLGGYNGVVMVCRSFEKTKKGPLQTSYIDCYDASDGKYLKSYTSSYGELESCAVDENNVLHVLFAQDRKIIKTKNVFNLVGKSASAAGTTQYEGNIVANKAKSYVGQKGTHFWEYSGLKADWCVMFVKCIFYECGLSDRTPTKGSWVVSNFASEMSERNFTKVSEKNSKPGDIVIYSTSAYQYAHVEIVTENGNTKSCGGNTGSDDYTQTTVKNRKHGGTVKVIFRPPYKNITTSGTGTSTSIGLEVHPEKLYSSSNYKYLEQAEDERASNSKQAIKDLLSKYKNGEGFTPLDTQSNIEIITSSSLDDKRLPKTKINGEVYGPSLPIALDPIEAPFVELTIGEVTFGSYNSKNPSDKFPNYISGLNVIRTNGSINEYTIELIHQIRPGSNPNYIDELLAKNGYGKIKIKYGDANSNIIFIDDKALLIGSDVSFDFISCNIKYTIKATSSAMSIASHKRTFASVEDKPSNIIRQLLYGDNSRDLIAAFPEMVDRNYVERNGLIPTDDKVTAIDEYKNINVVTYLKNLVASMSSMVYDNSSYYLIMENDKFRIVELQSDSVTYDAALYEVDINYIDKNQVFDFSVDTNYSWPIAYEYGSNISNYNYDYQNNGQIKTYNTNSTNFLDFSSQAQQNLIGNWWTNVTEFPITAKLECRGLLSPLLLLTYIKVNCLYFGNDRITSGVYIVTGQQDILNGNGYRSILSLTRVSGPQQHLTVSGRVTT